MSKEIYTSRKVISKAEMLILDEFRWMRKRIAWLEEIAALAQEHELLDLSNSNEWPQWEDWENNPLPWEKEADLVKLRWENYELSKELEELDNE